MNLDSVMREMAEGQHGAVARWQLHAAGADDDHVSCRAASPEWALDTPRVLRLVGSPRTPQQRAMVAILDGGPGANGAGETAAAVWRLPGFRFGRLEVIQTRVCRSHTPSIGVLHTPRLLLPSHTTVVDGIPVTTVARTVFDLAHRLHPERLERVVNTVVARSPGTLVALRQMLGELGRRGRPGIAKMRAVLATMPADYKPRASGLELRFEHLLEEAGEAPLERQVDVGGHDWLGRVDYVDWRIRCVFEVDSILHHTSPLDVKRDAQRDEALLDAGFRRVVRVPEEDIWYRPWAAVEAVRKARAELVTDTPGGARNICDQFTEGP